MKIWLVRTKSTKEAVTVLIPNENFVLAAPDCEIVEGVFYTNEEMRGFYEKIDEIRKEVDRALYGG